MGRFYSFLKNFCPVVCPSSNYLVDGQHKATVPLSTTIHLKAKTMKKLLLLTTVLTALMVSIPPAHADPLDKSSPKIAHGMYRDRGKSSPKIAEGMRSDVAGHLMVESSGIRKSPAPTRGVYRDRGKSSPKIAERRRSDVLGHLMIEATGIRKSPTPTRGVYRDRGKSSPKIAEGMRSDVLGHLLIEATGIRKSPAPTRGRLEHGPGLRK
jgi:hypothetical protein